MHQHMLHVASFDVAAALLVVASIQPRRINVAVFHEGGGQGTVAEEEGLIVPYIGIDAPAF